MNKNSGLCKITTKLFFFSVAAVMLEIGLGHLLGEDPQQVHHVAETDAGAVVAADVHLPQQPVHGIIGDICQQPCEVHHRRLRGDIELLQLQVGVGDHVDIGAAVHAAVNDLQHLAHIRNEAVAVEGTQIDQRIGLEPVLNAVDHHFSCTGAHQHKDLIPVIGIGRRGLDTAQMGADILGQHVVGEIVVGPGKIGVDSDGAFALVFKGIFVSHCSLSRRSAVFGIPQGTCR